MALAVMQHGSLDEMASRPSPTKTITSLPEGKPMPTVPQIFENMEKRIVESGDSVREDVDGIYRFVLTKDEEPVSTWIVNCKDDLGCKEGDGDADLTLTLEEDIFVGIYTGEVNGMEAFMGGQILADGDMGLAMKLGDVLGA